MHRTGTVKVLISPAESTENSASGQGMGEGAIKLGELRQVIFLFGHSTGSLGWAWKWRGENGKRLRNPVCIVPRRGLKSHSD